MNTYREFIDAITQAVEEAKSLHLGGMEPCVTQTPSDDAPRALIFSPHPDDECIIGTLPLRLLREDGFQVVNVAVTQGSRKDRQQERFEELEQACRFLGFSLLQTKEGGLEKIKPETRQAEPEHWKKCTEKVKTILESQNPQLIFLPHAEDWNGTHIGTHYLIMDALAKMPNDFSCILVETEYWQPMTEPNLLVECSAELLADLVAGLSHHKGEVARNPYHLLLPAWMQDNVRRGSELIGGQGGDALDFYFAAIYRLKLWEKGKVDNAKLAPTIIDAETTPLTALRSVLD